MLETELGPLQERYAPVTAEPSLQMVATFCFLIVFFMNVLAANCNKIKSNLYPLSNNFSASQVD